MKLQRSIAVLFFFAAFGLVVSVRAQVVIWSGTADWSTAGNWSPTGVPGAGNTAQVSSGVVTVSDARSVGAIAFSTGTLTGAGTLTLTGTGSTWNDGNMTFANGGGAVNAVFNDFASATIDSAHGGIAVAVECAGQS